MNLMTVVMFTCESFMLFFAMLRLTLGKTHALGTPLQKKAVFIMDRACGFDAYLKNVYKKTKNPWALRCTEAFDFMVDKCEQSLRSALPDFDRYATHAAISTFLSPPGHNSVHADEKFRKISRGNRQRRKEKVEYQAHKETDCLRQTQREDGSHGPGIYHYLHDNFTNVFDDNHEVVVSRAVGDDVMALLPTIVPFTHSGIPLSSCSRNRAQEQYW